MKYFVVLLIMFSVVMPKIVIDIRINENDFKISDSIHEIPISHTRIVNQVTIKENFKKLEIQGTRSIAIKDVWIEPTFPEYNDNVTVYAVVLNAEEVYLNWTDGKRFHYIKMNLITPLENKYTTVIPAHAYGTMIYFRIQAFNYTFNESIKTDWFSFVFDDFTPPNITKVSFPNTTLTLNEILITLNASEDENASGLYSAYVVMQYSRDNKTWSDEYVYEMNYNSTGKYFYLKLSFTNYGYYKMYFIAEDFAENQARSPKDANQYYYIRVLPRIAKIRILLNNTEVNEIQVRYTDATKVLVQALDLNGTYVINGEIEIRINDDVVGYICTNETGFAEFYLVANRDVGEYNLTLTLYHPAYKTVKLIIKLKVVKERTKIMVNDVDSQTYNISLIITVRTDDNEKIPSGNIRIISGGKVVYDKHLTSLENVKIIMNVFKLKTIINDTNWVALLTIEFYGSKNYENCTRSIIIEIKATLIGISYDKEVKQGGKLSIYINASDPDYIRQIIVKIDDKKILNKTFVERSIELSIAHNLTINETVGEHKIIVIVRDMLNNEVSRDFKFIVIQARIILKSNITRLSNGVYINGTARYDVEYNASLINILIEIRIGSDRKFIEPNKTCNNTILLFNATIKFYGSALIRVVAYDEYNHRSELEAVVNIPYKPEENENSMIIALILTTVVLITVLGVKLKRRKTS